VGPATEGDLPAIATIATEAWRNAYRGLISAEAIDDSLRHWYSIESLQRRLRSGGLEVAEREDRTVGFVQHARTSDLVHEVFAVYVLPTLIGKGVGWSMWQRVLQEAVVAHSAWVELWVLQGNSLGTDWYDRQGGEVVAERQVQMLDGPHTELRYRFTLGGAARLF